MDLVVCSVRVDRHVEMSTPSIRAGKDIYVEWPLGKNVAEATELWKLTQEHNTKLAVVGLQGRYSPVISKLKELVKSERLGKVLSSTLTCCSDYGGNTVVKGFEYALDAEAGAGLVGIFLGHTVDWVQEGMYVCYVLVYLSSYWSENEV